MTQRSYQEILEAHPVLTSFPPTVKDHGLPHPIFGHVAAMLAVKAEVFVAEHHLPPNSTQVFETAIAQQMASLMQHHPDQFPSHDFDRCMRACVQHFYTLLRTGNFCKRGRVCSPGTDTQKGQES